SWGSHLRSMFKFQKSDSPVSVRESYEIRQLQGKVFDVTLVKLGERTLTADDYTIDKKAAPPTITFHSGVLKTTESEEIYLELTVE
ncbi:MAG: hypothetical protein OXC40_03210, partial [Proteobacteria bacterium]|nr:hypothetical protein [Pseudomonadota bacterium]